VQPEIQAQPDLRDLKASRVFRALQVIQEPQALPVIPDLLAQQVPQALPDQQDQQDPRGLQALQETPEQQAIPALPEQQVLPAKALLTEPEAGRLF
jgi:hypothetical protein